MLNFCLPLLAVSKYTIAAVLMRPLALTGIYLLYAVDTDGKSPYSSSSEEKQSLT